VTRCKRSVLILTCIIALTSTLIAQEPAGPAALFQQLQASGTTDRATQILLQRGAADPEVRKYISSRLPAMINIGWKGQYKQWKNAVRLAGELKIAEAVPALAKWISLDNVGETSAGEYQRLETNPAAKALSQIGDPAIPALVNVIEHGTTREKWSAYFALNLIASPRAYAAIHDRRELEDDPNIRAFIDKTDRMSKPNQ
jgi:HEAT repeat protein